MVMKSNCIKNEGQMARRKMIKAVNNVFKYGNLNKPSYQRRLRV